MRIIAGSAKGTKIEAPEGLTTRPVTDKIRQSLFNIWQFDIAGSSFLDVFAGSGSMGIEALSRGAAQADFIERNREAVSVISRNLEKTHLQDKGNVLAMDAFQALKKLDQQQKKYDYIYLDPPYTVDEIFIPIMETLAGTELLKSDGIAILRSLKEKEMPERFGSLVRYRTRDYGISRVHFYCHEKLLKED